MLVWCFYIILALASVLDGQTLGGPMHGKVVVCYIASWAAYRPEGGKFILEDLDPSLCTHLVYSFTGLDEHNFGIKTLDAWQDLDKGKAGYKRIVKLKERYPHLKVTIAIGGWNEGSAKYSKMANSTETRERFINSVLQFLQQHKFDGLDLDWEYPTRRDGNPEDRANYVSLVKELKEAFEPHKYILTAALGAGKETMDSAYDLPKLSKYLDLIHMMCYDYHGTWDGVVGANAPLKGISDNDVLSLDYTINYMLSHKVSPYKLVLGLPMYGRNFLLRDPNTKEIEFGKTPAQSQGFKGPYTREAGFMGYNEICAETTNKSSSWSSHWDEATSTPYLRDGERLMTYDNARSIALKVKTAIDYGLGGLMVWSIDTDDFKGVCDPEKDAYVDFVERCNKIADDPVLHEALKTLSLPDDLGSQMPSSHIGQSMHRHNAYTISNGRLHLRLPEQDYSNYNLMRTINDAAHLALEEKRILDEMARISRENEIPDTEGVPDAGCMIVTSVPMILCFVLFIINL